MTDLYWICVNSLTPGEDLVFGEFCLWLAKECGKKGRPLLWDVEAAPALDTMIARSRRRDLRPKLPAFIHQALKLKNAKVEGHA